MDNGFTLTDSELVYFINRIQLNAIEQIYMAFFLLKPEQFNGRIKSLLDAVSMNDYNFSKKVSQRFQDDCSKRIETAQRQITNLLL